jgi:hypothetical protein
LLRALNNISVRKVNNDKVDAYKIAMLYRLKVLRTSQVPVDSLRGFGYSVVSEQN